MPVVKSNAYGHGMELVATLLEDLGLTWFGVNGLDEGLDLRRHLGATSRILVLGYTDPARFGEALDAELDLTVSNVDEIRRLDAEAAARDTRARLHVKVECGTHRRGLPAEALPELIGVHRDVAAVDWVGVSTHFANIEDTLNHAYAEEQLARFTSTVDTLADNDVRFERRHVACSAASLLFPKTHFDMLRVGISLYGLWPSRETRVSAQGTPAALTPALAWRARLAEAKPVAAGAYIGYGCTYRTSAPSVIGVVPVGYYEGYARALSNVAHVLVGGRRAPVRGRVCMNMFMVDLTHVPDAAVGDVVTLIGSDGDERVSADDLAAWSGTIHYEIVSRIHPDLPRVPKAWVVEPSTAPATPSPAP